MPCPTTVFVLRRGDILVRRSRARLSHGLALGSVVLALQGCGALQAQERIVTPDAARHAVERVTGMTLTEEPSADRSSMVNLLATFAGRDERRAVTVLVFDGRQAIVQALGRTRAPAPEPGAVAIRDRNILVFYGGDTGRRRMLERVLSSLPEVPEDKVPRAPGG